jgi:hypothetical protein
MPPIPSPDPSSPSVGQPFDHQLSLTKSPLKEEEMSAQSLKNLESTNIHGQLQWEKHMKEVDLKRRYRKVSVLMIHWEKEGTESVDTQKEVCFDRRILIWLVLLTAGRWIVSATCSARDIDSMSRKKSSTLVKIHSYKSTSTFLISFVRRMTTTLCSSYTTPATAPQIKSQVACCWQSKHHVPQKTRLAAQDSDHYL